MDLVRRERARKRYVAAADEVIRRKQVPVEDLIGRKTIIITEWGGASTW